MGRSARDGRHNLGDPDIYTARLLHTFAAGCASDDQALVGTTFNFTDQVTNASVMFPCTVNYTLTADRNWPGLPIDRVHHGPGGQRRQPAVRACRCRTPRPTASCSFCLTATLPNGALHSSCCLNLTVSNPRWPRWPRW